MMLMRTQAAADYLGVSASYLQKLRCVGGGPQFVKPTRKLVAYRKEDLDTWLENHVFCNTSEHDAGVC